MNNAIYKIKGLACKYPKGKFPVLVIDTLDIEEGSIVFFIGASGVGKSTILETLGLMNNTIFPNDKSIFEFSINQEKENFLNIWKKNETKIAEFRRNHFSFIFQSTNLFSTLSAYENVLITPLLQGNSREESINTVKEIFCKILPELRNDKKITELSGGQRQRLAFARAVATDYTVLFADEPTGNLDWANANKLMSVLIDNIRTHNKTAIIVSHDINLAIKYADKIVLIEKKTSEDNGLKYKYGKISDESIFYRKSENIWSKNSDSTFLDTELSQHLQESLIGQAAIYE